MGFPRMLMSFIVAAVLIFSSLLVYGTAMHLVVRVVVRLVPGTPYLTRVGLPMRAWEWRLLGSATPGVPGTPYLTRVGLPMRAREWRLLGSATPDWRKVVRYQAEPLPSESNETELCSASQH